jgi:prepilin-type N-terminal cleavage/methylation domain-containing protein
VKGDRHPGKFLKKSTQGFTLIELMVVMVIVGILATGVVFMFANPSAKVKTQAFELLGEINYARSVSVSENRSVLVDFVLGAQDSYQICFDTDTDDGDCSNEPADNILKEVILRNDVQFYDFTGTDTIPTDGPTKTPSYSSVAAGTELEDKNGIILHDPTTPATILDYLEMQPDGTCNQEGAVIIYLHEQGNPEKIRGTPYAVVIGSASTGQVKLSRWRSEMDDDAGTTYDDRWNRK